jgi:CheY-like chemotaxis protein
MPRILLVEDDPVSQKLALQILAQWKIDVTLATDGEEALRALKLEKFDVVLLDLMLPGISGIEVLRIIRNSPDARIRRIPVIACSGSDVANSMAKAQALGMNDALSKPINAAELHFKINPFLITELEERPVYINFDMFGENDQAFRSQLVSLMVINLRELQFASYRAFYSYDKHALLASLHKVKSTITILNDRELLNLIEDVKESFVSNEKKEVVQSKIRKLNEFIEGLIRVLEKPLDAVVS